MSSLYNHITYSKPPSLHSDEDTPHMSDKARMRLENQLLIKKVRSLNTEIASLTEEIDLLKSVINELDEEYFNEP